jgi:hypothetical protein
MFEEMRKYSAIILDNGNVQSFEALVNISKKIIVKTKTTDGLNNSHTLKIFSGNFHSEIEIHNPSTLIASSQKIPIKKINNKVYFVYPIYCIELKLKVGVSINPVIMIFAPFIQILTCIIKMIDSFSENNPPKSLYITPDLKRIINEIEKGDAPFELIKVDFDPSSDSNIKKASILGYSNKETFLLESIIYKSLVKLADPVVIKLEAKEHRYRIQLDRFGNFSMYISSIEALYLIRSFLEFINQSHLTNLDSLNPCKRNKRNI